MAWLRQNGWLGALVLSAGLLAACSSSPAPSVPAPPVAAASTGSAGGVATPTDAAAAAETVAGYALGPGDRVRLTVFRHEDLSGEFDVDGEGFLAMPLVGEIRAAGMNARQLESGIEALLKEGGYLVNPQVSIEVLNYRPFYIIGEVNTPGSYPYVNGMSVLTAVALAGGYTYRAREDRVSITRANDPQRREYRAAPDTPVLPGDIIKVPERLF